MSGTEDEQQSLDAGWDDEPSLPGPTSVDEEDVDQAWDSLPPPVSGMSGPASSMPPVTEAVDSGWDDVPEGAPHPSGKRRPHRQRRAKSNGAPAPVAASPVLLPRPAEPTKKQQREHARKQRAYEAQVKQQRKLERKQERAHEMRREAEAKKRQAEAEARERQQRREERERAERERPQPVKPARPKPTKPQLAKREAAPSGSERPRETPPSPQAPARGLRPGVLLTLAALIIVAFLLLWRK